jgi:hypothetical protein
MTASDRPHRATLAAGLLAAFCAIGAGAQSLPEVARQVRSERGAPDPTIRVFTNESIARTRGVVPDGGNRPAQRTSMAEPEGAAPGPDQETVGGLTEAEWRRRFADARQEITRAENRAALAEQQLQALNRRLLTDSSLYNREGQLRPQIAEQSGQLETARENLEAANRAVAELRDALRRAGGPAGWAR